MSAFGDIVGTAVGLLGVSKESEQRRRLSKIIKKELRQKPQPLEIPLPFKQLMTQLLGQADQLGASRLADINQAFNENLQRSIAGLRQRGLASSNLTANLLSGNERNKQRAINSLNEQLLGAKIGLQQGIGLQGLGTSSSERQQILSNRAGLINQLAGPVLVPSTNWFGSGGAGAGIASGISGIGSLLGSAGVGAGGAAAGAGSTAALSAALPFLLV